MVASPLKVNELAVSVPVPVRFPLAMMFAALSATVIAPTVPVPSTVPRVRVIGFVPAVVMVCKYLAFAPLCYNRWWSLYFPQR